MQGRRVADAVYESISCDILARERGRRVHAHTAHVVSNRGVRFLHAPSEVKRFSLGADDASYRSGRQDWIPRSRPARALLL